MTITPASAGADPALLDDPVWLREQYHTLGHSTYEIARMVGRAPNTIAHRLRKHGISLRAPRVSRNDYSGPWLARHYLDRVEYDAWCRRHEHEPDEDGGHGLSTSACAELAGVTRETVRQWLVNHGIERRGPEDLSARRRRQRHLFALGSGARGALRRFDAQGVVASVEVREREIRVEYATGLRERWSLHEDESHRLCFPKKGWWAHSPTPKDAHMGLLGGDAESADSSACAYTAKHYANLGFLDQRLLVAELVRDLTTEGWRRPEFTNEELEDDLRAVLADGSVHAPTPGYMRQPGRPPSGVPAGMRLALDLVNWGPLARLGGVTLQEAWSDPGRVYWAIESLIRRGENISCEGIIHRMCVGRAEGLPSKAGPRWKPPIYWVSLLRKVLGQEDGVIVVDPKPGCGSKAVAVAAMGGVYVCPSSVGLSRETPLWKSRPGADDAPEIVEDDDDCAHVALVECDGFDEFEEAVAAYGYRCEQVVSRLPWSDRVRVLGLPGARVVRLRSRPYRKDEIIAIWSQGSGLPIPMATG